MSVDYIKARFVENLSNKEYHALRQFVSSSMIRKMEKSPAHYRAALEEENEQTKAMIFGSACHTYQLEKPKFSAEYCVKPVGLDGRTKAGKDALAAFEAANLGKDVITADERRMIINMGFAIDNHDLAASIMHCNGKFELSCFFTNPETGIQCKFRPDILPGDCIIADYKTTEDASPEGFSRSCAKYGYDIQAAFYCEGMQVLTGKPHRFIFIAQEKTPPYAVAVYEASPDMLETGLAKVKRLLSKLQECIASDYWPGYSDSIEIIDLPKWAKTA